MMQPYCSSRETATVRSACDRSGCPHTSLERTRRLERLVRRSGGGGRGAGRPKEGGRGVPHRTRATTRPTSRRRRARWTQPSRRRRRRRRRRPTSLPLRRSILLLDYEGLRLTLFIDIRLLRRRPPRTLLDRRRRGDGRCGGPVAPMSITGADWLVELTGCRSIKIEKNAK